MLALAAVAWAGSFEICTVAANCKAAAPSTGLGGEMDSPFGVATDAAGNVYVADLSNHRIQKFDSSGNFQRAWGKDVASAGPGDTGTGFEICVAASGDTCKTGGTPTFPALGGEMNSPFGVATDAAGNVYVADTFNNRIQKFDSSGNFQRTWGRNVDSMTAEMGFEICTVAANCQGAGSTGLGGEMSRPVAVATDATTADVYVADRTNDRIQEFDSMGNFQRTWGRNVDSTTAEMGFEICTDPDGGDCKAADMSTGLGGEMDFPDGIGTDATTGDVYVADGANNRVQEFNSSGTFQRTWGMNVDSVAAGLGFEICTMAANCKAADTSTGLGGAMDRPTGIATDSDGNVYVAEQLDDRVQKFDTSGNFQRAWGKDVIQSMDPGDTGTGFEICTVAANCKAGSDATSLGGEMNAPFGVAVAPGNVYVADEPNDRIQKFDSSGNFLRTWGNDVDNTPPSAGPVATAPSNAFTIGGLDGKTLALNVSSFGTAEVTDAGAQAAGSRATAAAKKLLKPSSATGGPGIIEVTLKLTKAAKRKLREKGKVKVNARITFTPAGGTPSSQTRKLKIKRK